jgi:hypothetical protein
MSPNRSSRSNISRQFTEAEEAIDARLTDHLTAPPIEMHIGDRIGQSYQWLSEDLALRSTLSRQLADEQSMAYAQSTRHELANQAVREQEDDMEAVEGMRAINASIATGEARDWNEAASKFYNDKPGAFLNPKLSGMVTEGGRFFQTDKSREIAELRQDNELLGLGTDNFNKEVMQKWYQANPDLAERKLKMMDESLKGEEVTSHGAARRAQLQSFVTDLGFQEAEERKRVLDTVGTDPNGRAKAAYVISQSGLGITDVEALTTNFRGTATLGMLSDHRWLASNLSDPAASKELSDAINLVNDPDVKGAEKNAARAKVDALTGKYMADTEDAAKYQERRKALDSLATEGKKSYDTLSEDITKLVTNEKFAKTKEAPLEIVSKVKGWMRQHTGTSVAEKAVVDEYVGYLDNVKVAGEGVKAPATAAAARDLAGKFAEKIARTKMVVSLQGPSTTPAKAKEITSGTGKALDAATARGFLDQAGGDKARARELAIAAGFTL